MIRLRYGNSLATIVKWATRSPVHLLQFPDQFVVNEIIKKTRRVILINKKGHGDLFWK